MSLLQGLREAAVEVRVVTDPARRRLADGCFAVPEGADPALSPDPDEVEVVAGGATTGAAVLVWSGPTPTVQRALGSCVGVRRGDVWTLTNRGVRPDPGPGSPWVAWNQYASGAGAAAAVVGRVGADATEILVVLADGRVLRQTTDGYAALAWTPVVAPERLVVVGARDEVVYDGSVAAYR